MGRPRRAADGGLIYHVLNRANAGMTIFEKAEDFAAFERVLEEAVERTKTCLLAYCVPSLRLAAAPAGKLGGGGQCAADGGGTAGPAALGESRVSVWRGVLVRSGRPPVGAGKHPASPRAPKETRKRFLTPPPLTPPPSPPPSMRKYGFDGASCSRLD